VTKLRQLCQSCLQYETRELLAESYIPYRYSQNGGTVVKDNDMCLYLPCYQYGSIVLSLCVFSTLGNY